MRPPLRRHRGRHPLRHTHATALLMAGVPEHVVMRRLGHADVQTTLSTYGWFTAAAEMCRWPQRKNTSLVGRASTMGSHDDLNPRPPALGASWEAQGAAVPDG